MAFLIVLYLLVALFALLELPFFYLALHGVPVSDPTGYPD